MSAFLIKGYFSNIGYRDKGLPKNRKCLGVRSLVLSKCLRRGGGGELEEVLEHMNVCIFYKGLFFEHWL